MILRPVRPQSAYGPPTHEVARRVHVDLVVVVGELLGDDRADDLIDQVGADHAVAVDAFLVLCADEHALQGDGHAVLVFERHLGLAVGAQVRDLAGLADLGETLGEAVRRPDRDRHQIDRLVAGVAEHHALVAGALRLDAILARLAGTDLFADVDALGDVGALLVDRRRSRHRCCRRIRRARCRSRCR